jgi:hypothetical protein
MKKLTNKQMRNSIIEKYKNEIKERKQKLLIEVLEGVSNNRGVLIIEPNKVYIQLYDYGFCEKHFTGNYEENPQIKYLIEDGVLTELEKLGYKVQKTLESYKTGDLKGKWPWSTTRPKFQHLTVLTISVNPPITDEDLK